MKWAERIARAEKRHGFTPKDIELSARAGWCICFVGELFHIKHRRQHDGEDEGLPSETILRLGVRFGNAVEWGTMDEVKAIRDQIQKLK